MQHITTDESFVPNTNTPLKQHHYLEVYLDVGWTSLRKPTVLAKMLIGGHKEQILNAKEMCLFSGYFFGDKRRNVMDGRAVA